MPDKRKRGRRSGPGTDVSTLEKRVLRRYKHIRRQYMDSAVRGYNAKTIHMILAEEFHIPCQQVLDIIDPDREKQRVRIENYDRWKKWKAYSDAHWTRDYIAHPHLWVSDPESPEPAVMCADPECNAWISDWDGTMIERGRLNLMNLANSMVVC
jgi:hypothetical protein